MEALVGVEVRPVGRLGGPLDSWRVALTQPLPLPFSEPAPGESEWLYTFPADSVYRPPPDLLRCAAGEPTGPFRICTGASTDARGAWGYRVEVYREGAFATQPAHLRPAG